MPSPYAVHYRYRSGDIQKMCICKYISVSVDVCYAFPWPLSQLFYLNFSAQLQHFLVSATCKNQNNVYIFARAKMSKYCE